MAATLPGHKVASPSPVHSPETSLEVPTLRGGRLPLDAGGLADTFRHSGWRRHRRLIYESLVRTCQSASRQNAFCTCGWKSFVYRTIDPPHVYRLAGSACHDRFCVPCARDRSRCISGNILEKMKGEPARFITLTLKHCDDSLADQLARLYRSFQKLRQRTAWKRHVAGGCAFIEVKWIHNTKSWHPHLHCVVQGRFFPQELLRSEWNAVTVDSFVTDIRTATDEGKIANYVAKYASKPVNDTFINEPRLLDEVITALRGRRLCHTFGTWRGLRLTEVPDGRAWESIGDFHTVALAALDGDPESQDAIRMICGDRESEVLQSVRFARPPPKIKPEPIEQLTFTWPPVDRRF